MWLNKKKLGTPEFAIASINFIFTLTVLTLFELLISSKGFCYDDFSPSPNGFEEIDIANSSDVVRKQLDFLQALHSRDQYKIFRKYFSIGPSDKYCNKNVLLTKIKGKECGSDKYRCKYVIECTGENGGTPPLFVEGGETVSVRGNALTFYVGPGSIMYLYLGVDGFRMVHQN